MIRKISLHLGLNSKVIMKNTWKLHPIHILRVLFMIHCRRHRNYVEMSIILHELTILKNLKYVKVKVFFVSLGLDLHLPVLKALLFYLTIILSK